jgi:hypothetical protein
MRLQRRPLHGERGLDVFLSILFSDLDILAADQGHR